jgi:Phage major capsid protein E
MAFNSPYSTAQLLEVSRHIKTITPFWLSFFPRQINFETEEIFFDKVDQDYRKLAPLVVPNVQGRPMTLEGYTSVSFKPAYVKPKHAVDPSMMIERQAGEALGAGSLSLEQRRAAVVADIMRRHDSLLTNRNEWLAAKALIDGAVTLSGDDYPTTTVDFQRHASLTYTLAGAALWTAGTATPLEDIKQARINANNRSGAVIRRVVFGGTAWDNFTARVDLKVLMDKNYGGLNVNVQRAADGFEGQEYMGTYGGIFGGGAIDLWVDRSKYVDETGVEQFFLPQTSVVGFSDVEGVRCFGAIKDFGALRAMERFPKMWLNEDPSAEFLLTQSAPLMVPKKPNASFKIITS